ncbi:hypothetical protein X943_000167 [Babesia divergens]|uniref:ATPase AAA-type core domain-containing protein n=1 Tax=Babesia divergens TaxID=32595 RepID=A0AAD9GJ57_BABDI|nr:hypothetical protein X943_000167 [Babesia divergens]
MNDLYIDAVCLFITPLLTDPEEALQLKLIEWLVPKLLTELTPEDASFRIVRLRFLTHSQIKSLFGTIEQVCRLLDIAPSSIRLIHDREDLRTVEHAITCSDVLSERIQVIPATSAFETELFDIFIPLLSYYEYYCLYGLPSRESILLYGRNSGKKFVRWFRRLQKQAAESAYFRTSKKLDLHIIRIEDVLSPYFGESERRLVNMFETAVSTMDQGITCICIEGIHHFDKSKNLEDVDRRLLTTMLLLLDSVTKSDFIVQHGTDSADRTDGIKGSLVVVSTSERHPDDLSCALIRPGRLDKTIFVS